MSSAAASSTAAAAAAADATPPPYPEVCMCVNCSSFLFLFVVRKLNFGVLWLKMIISAVTTLREKEGSSKIAIAKYIEQNYSNLPANHANLLTQNLKRLKNAGSLSMNKKSYMLPRSVDDAAPPVSQANVPNNNHQQNAVPPAPASSQSQPTKTGRGRGRPPKNSNAVKSEAPASLPVAQADQQLSSAKRGRGRPKKIGGGPAAIMKVPTVGPSGSGRRPGRPKKLKPVRASLGSNGLPPLQPQADAQPISYAYSQGNVGMPNVVSGSRRRGRPRKFGSAVSPSAAAARPVGRPAGRPKKTVSRSGRPVGRPRKVIFLIGCFIVFAA